MAMQGSEAAGSVPAELGPPDEHGVYTYNSSTGSVFFRQSHRSYGPATWEFSTDKALWISVSHVSSNMSAAFCNYLDGAVAECLQLHGAINVMSLPAHHGALAASGIHSHLSTGSMGETTAAGLVPAASWQDAWYEEPP